MYEQNTQGFSLNQKFVIFLVAVVCLASVLVVAIIRERIVAPVRYTITVSAEGEAIAAPDIATVTIGVKTPEKMKVSQVVAENTEAMNKIIKAIKDQGVEEKDIKTVTYRLYPVYDYTERAGRRLKGYTLTQEVQVKIRNLEKIGQIIEVATASGANQVGDVSFTIDDQDALKTQARNKAIEKAKNKAKEISNASGVRLGKIVNVTESAVPTTYPVYKYMEETAGRGGAGVETPQIEAGEMEINVTVSLTYEVK